MRLCEEAVRFGTASVCIPPCFVAHARGAFPKLNIGTVIGFPLGYDCTSTKLAATKTALDEGAGEFDMVINLTDVKMGEFGRITDEIARLKEVARQRVLKVIIETCYLTEDEKVSMCHVVTKAGADYIKTSTGLGTAGATLADIELFRDNIGPDVKMKAAGGIRSRDDMVAFIEAGCSRLGTSSAVKLLTGGEAGAY